jgi:hypothetical protein
MQRNWHMKCHGDFVRKIIFGVVVLLFDAIAISAQSYVIDASKEPGGDASAQLMAACAALPNGGTIDASSYGGTTRYISSPVSCGSEAHPVSFIFSPSTVFVPVGTATQMFELTDGMTIRGTLVADVTSVPDWSGAVIGLSGSIWKGTYHTPNTAIENLLCRGNSADGRNATGSCIRFMPSVGNRVTFLRSGSTTVTGMAYGIQLVADDQGTGTTTNITGNWFEHVVCVETLTCVSMTANGRDTSTQVSENHFPGMQVEFDGLTGYQAISAKPMSNGQITSNDFSDIIFFDGIPSSSVMDFETGTHMNQVTGFMCSGICGGITYTDKGDGNIISDQYVQGRLSSFYPFVSPSGFRNGWLAWAPSGITMGLDPKGEFRIEGGNGGLQLGIGVGADHGLYLNSLDPQTRAIYFNNALAINGNIVLPSATNGYQGSGTKVAIPVYGTAKLIGGAVSVSTSAACSVSSTCVYKLTNCGTNGSRAVGTLAIGSVSVGSGFLIRSLSNTGLSLIGDNSTVCWQIN